MVAICALVAGMLRIGCAVGVMQIFCGGARKVRLGILECIFVRILWRLVGSSDICGGKPDGKSAI
jgi:hypothetical protein